MDPAKINRRQLDFQESPLFDKSYYIAQNYDLQQFRGSLWLHYIQYGRHEGRDARYQLETIPSEHPIRRLPAPLIMENCFYAKAFYTRFHQFLAYAEGPLRLTINRVEDFLDLIASREQALRPLTKYEGEALFVSGEPNTAGHHYRVARPSAAIRSLNLSSRILTTNEKPLDGHEIQEGITRYIFIWRLRKKFIQDSFLTKARELNIPVVYDVDDYMFNPSLVDQGQVDAIRYLQIDKAEIRKFYADIRSAIRQADFAIAPTLYLSGKLDDITKTTHLVPNTYSADVYTLSRFCAFQKQFSSNGSFRIGYLGGSVTHQKDFSFSAAALAKILHAFQHVRLVLYRDANSQRPFLDLNEFPELLKYEHQIEMRDSVKIEDLPLEISRLDLNIAPLELNDYCHSKSELKYFEAAICGVPTIASPTETYKSCIKNGYNGFLAETEADWLEAIKLLIMNPSIRRTVATAALKHASIYYGPCQLKRSLHELILRTSKRMQTFTRPPRFFSDTYDIPEVSVANHRIVWQTFNRNPQHEQVSIVIPNYNYSTHITTCLESVFKQTHIQLELIICDDKSTDNSLNIILDWIHHHSHRFTRIVLAVNEENSGLGATRNLAIELSSSYWYFAIDPDNHIAPRCIESCLSTLGQSYAHFCYPLIRQFGGASHLMGNFDYDPYYLSKGNKIDAMALVTKSAFFRVGGYYNSKVEQIPNGWEDYDFWCKCIESDMHGVSARRFGELAFYRVHTNSMLATETNIGPKHRSLISFIRTRHPWTQPLG